MLAKRVIPVLLVRGRQLVKGQQFKSWRSVGVAEQAARIYAKRGVDELVILDIAATPEGRGPDFAMVERMTAGNFCPVSVGGGVRSVESVRSLLYSGADKVVIGTSATRRVEIIEECADRFGRQAIAVSIDHDGRSVFDTCGTINSMRGPVGWAKTCREYGAGEIILTSVDRDGMMQGYDLDMIRAVSDAVDIPVIASGGCGSYEHMYEAIKAGASAVAASSMFLFTENTPRGAAEYLNQRGITCRI
jgi:imidazole glycerol-phosphate synthase subunit HisF